MRPTKLLAVLLVAISLAGCVSITSAPAGKYSVVKTYDVTLGQQWSDITVLFAKSKNVRVLSVDGPLLNRLYLAAGLAPGQYMVRPLRKELPTPTVKADMSATERIEFVSDSVAALDYQRVETSRPRPAKFGDADAVRFDLTAKTSEGLDIKGTAVVAEVGGKLHLILFLAPAEHYFQKDLAEVERLMASARVTTKG